MFLCFQSLPFFGVEPAILDEAGVEIKGPGKGYLVNILLLLIEINVAH